MQIAFYYDQTRCIGCNTCIVACKDWNDIPAGPVAWRKLTTIEKGKFPELFVAFLTTSCYHCEKPACVDVCPTKAIYKEEKYGAVLVDFDKCQGTRKCWFACPYGSPQFRGDEPGTKMSKCNMCIDRLGQGLKPICVLSCSMRALEFGPLDELREKYGDLRRLEDMPRDTITNPAVVFKAADPKRKVIPWDYNQALELWQKRELREDKSLPDVFTVKSEVTEAPRDIVGRNKLMLKAKSSAEQKYYTTDDE